MSLADGAAERSSSAAHLTKALRFQRRRRGSHELSNPRTDEVEATLICKSINMLYRLLKQGGRTAPFATGRRGLKG